MKQRAPVALIVAFALCLLAAPSWAGEQHEIVVKDLGGGLSWATSFDYGHATLTITGPKKFVFSKSYGRDEVVWDAGSAPDGRYRWRVDYRNELPKGLSEELQAARKANDEQFACELVDQGVIQSAGFSGYFAILKGELMVPKDEPEEPVKARARHTDPSAALGGTRVPTKDHVILDDLIVDGSACIGFDCVNGESFGFDTLRLKENNLRIKFQDTSVGNFPSNDWLLVANDSANGGANKFSIEDVDGNRTPFTLEARAPSHSLYVDDGGRIGLGTSIPVVELHVKSGDSPTLRLEQDGTSGFAPQTWDVAGNETNFFVRDSSNGSTLPFRIRPGANTDSLAIDDDSDVGVGTVNPSAALHVRRNDGNARLFVEETNAAVSGRTLMELKNNGQLSFSLIRSDLAAVGGAADNRWSYTHNGTTFDISKTGTGANELSLNENGNLSVRGSFISAGMTLNVPDYVFDPAYELMPLDDLRTFIDGNRHLPNVPSASEVKAGGLDLTAMQLRLLEKVEELTLYTLDQDETIRRLEARLAELEGDASVQ